MYIEDIIIKLNQSSYFITGNYLFSKFVGSPEFKVISSMGEQLSIGTPLTERQALLAMRILVTNQHMFQEIDSKIPMYLITPAWKYKFRTLPTTPMISIASIDIENKNTRIITLQFPFEEFAVRELRERNHRVHSLYKGKWNVRERTWQYHLTEKNILDLGNLFLNSRFIADAEFMGYYNELTLAIDELDKHVPMLAYSDGNYIIKNAHAAIPQPDTESAAEAAFFARKYGITVWDDSVHDRINLLSDHTKKILSSTNKDRIWFDDRKVPITEFEDIVKYGDKILIVVPGGSELVNTKNWVNFAESIGVDTKNISVMFRLPGEQNAFNEYIKNTGLNNPITENTKIVFVSTKITKPLVKSGIHFTTVINLGYYNYLHFSMNAQIDGVCNKIYYSMKTPTEQTSWQQHEL